MVRLHTYGKHRRRRTASKTLTAHIATQGKTTKTLRRMPEMPQFAAFRSATQGKLPKNVRREQLANRPADFAAGASTAGGRKMYPPVRQLLR